MIEREDVPNAGSWDQLDPPLHPNVAAAIFSAYGFAEMTPVQSSTIPYFIRHRDVVVEAVTGSGKTLAYLVPLLHILLRRDHALTSQQIGAIVISPTRELAQQIDVVLKPLLKDLQSRDSVDAYPLKSILITGGYSEDEDLRRIRTEGAQILIATPGKLEDLLKHHANAFQVKELEVLVLDEADRLLDMGFEVSLRHILQHLPKQRRTALFSATMTDGLQELVKAGLRNPTRIVVKVEDAQTHEIRRVPPSLNIYYSLCPMQDKFVQFLTRLSQDKGKRTIVFFCTCLAVDYYYKILKLLSHIHGRPIFSLHGKMDGKKRMALFDKFKATEGGILLCTDVASRGLDIPDVDVVLHYDPPQDPQAFLHRCGRTARQGKSGEALVWLQPQEDTYIEFLRLRHVPLKQSPLLDPLDLHTDRFRITPPAVAPNDYKDTSLFASPLRRFIQSHLLSDRELYLKSVQAFVSFIKSYREHQLKFVFQFKALPMDQVAANFFLLRLPKCNELKNMKIVYPEVICPAAIERIAFSDPQRELKRQAEVAEKLKKRLEGGGGKRKVVTGAWSDHREAKERRNKRRAKKQAKREFIGRQTANEPSKEVIDESEDDLSAEWTALKKEERLAKKVKQGKIKPSEMEEALSYSSDASDS